VKWLAICASLTAFVLALPAQDSLPDWVLLLSRIKHHSRQDFEHIPNYVCQETVERFEKTSARAPLKKLDSLRFEVAHVEHKELLALPGAARFEDVPPSALMSSGMLGTGAFSSLPLNLFVADIARITPQREAAQQTPDRLAYDFEIPVFLSGFRITAQGMSAVVGERGTFWVDANSLDLIRIEVHAVDVPPQVGMSAIDTTVEYARVSIGGDNVLLPQSAVQVAVRLVGPEQRNELKFSGCREYSSESTVRFGDTVDPPQVAKKK
jgi:hypothetical protein